MLEVQDGNLISGEASKEGDANKMWKLRKCDTAEPVTVLEVSCSVKPQLSTQFILSIVIYSS